MQQQQQPLGDWKYENFENDTSSEEVQRFIDTEQLPKTLTFAKTDKFTKYTHCGAWALALASYGITCFAPVPLFCPTRVTEHFELKLDQETLTFHSAYNDCCLHIAKSTKTVPLQNVQDVQLQEGCCETCFSLKKIQIQTAGMNGPNGAPEVVATFLRDPEQARQAIQLAVKLSRARAMIPPVLQPVMERAPEPTPAAAPRGSTMQDRLQRLNQLRDEGVLSAKETDQIRAKVLSASKDFTLNLLEAQALLTEGLVSEKDFKQIREELLAQIQSRS